MTQKIAICAPLHNLVELCLCNKGMYRQSEKNLLNSNISSTCPHNPTNGWDLLGSLGHPRKFQPVSQLGFITAATSLTKGPTKLCTMFGRLLGWYTIYTFSGPLSPWRNFVRCKIHFVYRWCILQYWQCYCTALQQWPSAKLWSVVQGMKLRNFCRGHHLYSAGWPSRWASADILDSSTFLLCPYVKHPHHSNKENNYVVIVKWVEARITEESDLCSFHTSEVRSGSQTRGQSRQDTCRSGRRWQWWETDIQLARPWWVPGPRCHSPTRCRWHTGSGQLYTTPSAIIIHHH